MRYLVADFALVRVPALPASALVDALAACPAGAGWREPYADWLTTRWRAPGVAAAIRHAAPDLADAIERDLDRLAGSERALMALGRYVNRMSTRPAPFGLLAGVAGATFGPDQVGLLALPSFLEPVERPAHPGPVARVRVSDLVLVSDGFVRLDAGDSRPVVLRVTRPVAAILERAREPVAIEEPGARLVDGLCRLGVLVPIPAPPAARGHIDSAARFARPPVLPEAVRRLASEAAAALASLGAGQRYPSALGRFAAEFTERYGQAAEVPVLEALSRSQGIGPPAAAEPEPGAGERNRLLLRLAGSALARRSLAVELDAATLQRLAGEPDGRQDAPAADLCLRLGVDAGGRWRAVVVGTALTGALAGRFADLVDGDLRELARREERAAPDHDFVELSYWPSSARARGLVARVNPRRHRLAVDVDGESTLRLADVLVGVANGRISMRHGQTGRLLHFTQASTLRHDRAPAVCRFLLEASTYQFRPLTAFDWGAAADGPFTPRLVWRSVVLAPARWTLPADEVERHPGTWLLPRHVALVDGDRRLLLDLESGPSRWELRRAGARGPLVLEEALPSPEETWLHDAGGGRYASEVVVTAVRPTPARANAPRPAPRASAADRRRLPGSEWLALHLYLPRAHQDRVVVEALADLGHGELFFVRYADPAPHLRIRVRDGRADDLLAWTRRWRARVAIADVWIRSYDREVERYGGPEVLPAVERLFCADSRAVAELLAGPGGATPAALSLLRCARHLVGGPVAQLRLLRLMSDSRAGAREYRDARDELWRRLGEPSPLDPHWAAPAAALAPLLSGETGDRVAASLLHLHANRLGLRRAGEAVALGMARRLAERVVHAPAEVGV